MSNFIEIKPYSKNYNKQIIQLILTIQTEEFNVPISLDQQPDLLDISGFYQKGVGNFWVAVINEKVIGTIAILDIGNSQIALRKMFVDEKYRGKTYGVAKYLLDTVFSWSKANDVHEIYLGTTAKFLAAQRFYEKNGFEEVERSKLPVSFPIMLVDSKFYKYTI